MLAQRSTGIALIANWGGTDVSDRLTKIHVDLPNHWATGGESLWATDLGGDCYRIENVPFYAYGLNFHDVVVAKPKAPDLKPTILDVLERSGHRTIRIFFGKEIGEEARLSHLEELSRLHTSFERCHRSYFALDLEPQADLEAVERHLRQWIADGIAEYETCEARSIGSFDDTPHSSDES